MKAGTYVLEVSGCDDTTYAELELTATEAEFLARVADAVTKASQCGCQPTMSLEPGGLS